MFYGRVGEGTVPLAIVDHHVNIDGSFVKHKIPVKPIYRRDGPQFVVGGVRQGMCMAGAGHDA